MKTIDERVHEAMSGLRLKTDELCRPASHDEVEALLRRVVAEAEAEILSSLPTMVQQAVTCELERLAKDIKA